MDTNEDIILLTDDEGEDVPFQIISVLVLDGCDYAILAPLDEEDDDGILIFRIVTDGLEQAYEPVEDDALMQRVFDAFRASDENYEFCDAK